MEDNLNIVLTHRFWSYCYDINELLVGCDKFETFIKRLIKQSIKPTHKHKWDPDTYKGEGFEAFVEFWFKANTVDNRIGITNYKPASQSGLSDNGVDGYGVGLNGNPATVQCKFRSDPTYTLTANADHLTNFLGESLIKYNVHQSDSINMLIVHTGKGLHHHTREEMLHGKVRELSRKDICNMVNFKSFWDSFRLTIDSYLVTQHRQPVF